MRVLFFLIFLGLMADVSAVTKYANADVKFTITGNSTDGTLTNLLLMVDGPTQSYSRTANFAATSSETRSWTLQFTELGTYSVTGIAIDSLGMRAEDLGSFEVINRPPVITTFSASSNTPEWTQPITINVNANDPDENLTQVSWDVTYPDSSTENVILWNSSTADGEAIHASSYAFTTSLAKGIGDYSLTLTAIDAAGLTATSSLTVTPVNPTKTVTVSAKGIPPTEKSLWFTESPENSESITVRKYPQN